MTSHEKKLLHCAKAGTAVGNEENIAESCLKKNKTRPCTNLKRDGNITINKFGGEKFYIAENY